MNADQSQTEEKEIGEQKAPTDEKYPTVSAIEQRLLGKDYAGEPIDQRLNRLETKAFGKPSKRQT